MANPYRGEVDAVIDGAPATLRLTLGALAELETSLAAEGLVDLAERFDRGSMRTADVIAVLTAGLRGAGREARTEEVAKMTVEGGAVGAARLAARLLAAAFTGAAS